MSESSRFSPIDPASVGMISVVEVPDKEAILRTRMQTVKSRWAFYDPPFGAQYDVENLEFDPIKIAQESGTAQEIAALSRINTAARATSLLYATGEDLDVIGSRYPGGVPRLNKGAANEEKDDRYRYRIWLSSNAFSTAGAPLAYVFWALTAVPELRDATAICRRVDLRSQPFVVVTLQAERSWNVNGATVYAADQPSGGVLISESPQPTQAQILAVTIKLQDKAIGPATDVISVGGPTVVDTPYDVGLYLQPYADHDQAITNVTAALTDLREATRYLGIDQVRMRLSAATNQLGVQNSIINSPPADVALDETQLGGVSSVRVAILGERQ